LETAVAVAESRRELPLNRVGQLDSVANGGADSRSTAAEHTLFGKAGRSTTGAATGVVGTSSGGAHDRRQKSARISFRYKASITAVTQRQPQNAMR